MEIATLFESENFDKEEAVTPFKELYPFIRSYFQNFCNENNIEYDGEREITFNKTKMTFYVNYSPKIRRYFLCIVPKNIWDYSYKKVLLPAFNETIEFFKKLPDTIEVGEVKFSKSIVTEDIDIKEWTFTTNPDVGINSLTQITNFNGIRGLGSSVFEKKKGTINQKLLVINAGGIINTPKLNSVIKKISPLFDQEPEVLTYNDSILETIENRADNEDLFVLFFGTRSNIDLCYSKFKQYFISKEIPSQFIGVDRLDNKLTWGFENLIFEILKKTLESDPISLDVLPDADVDGFLCLSDIGIFQNNKFFGISVSFTGSGSTEDWLEVYNDVDFATRYDDISFEYGEITKLSDKIKALSNLDGKTIDVFVTKRWHTRDVGYLSRLLERNNIKVRKFLYIGSKANRFLFSSLENETEYLYKHPYIIWDNRAASLQTNSKMQLYGTMFPIYIELLNPWTEENLSEEDLRLILWLVKKRIYRIANFYNLKIPELVSLLDQVRSLNIKDIPGRLKISLHTLI